MTFSILGRDPRTGHIGVAVASRFLAVGAHVPYVRARVAVATQAFINPLFGLEGAERLAAGDRAQAVVADLIGRDAEAARRQLHVMDADGGFAGFTGEMCGEHACHLVGAHCSVAGNELARPEVLPAMIAAFDAPFGVDLPERLLAAIEAGERAGGDRRGRQSAALRVHRGADYPWIDLRADDHPDPLKELRRLLAIAGERYLPFADRLAASAVLARRRDAP